MKVGMDRLEQVSHAPLLIETPHTYLNIGGGEKLQPPELRCRLAERMVFPKGDRLIKSTDPAEQALGYENAEARGPRLRAHRESRHGGGEIEQEFIKRYVGDRPR